ncbi:MAG: PAS domain-containing protein [Oxalobacter sp.]|nr:PAS domain-containing protein [Oxalobacter sp.]
MEEPFKGLELLSSAVLILNRDGKICYANPAAEDMLGLSLKVVSGMAVERVFLNSDVLWDICAQVIADETVEVARDIVLDRPAMPPLTIQAVAKALTEPIDGVLVEMRENVQRIRHDRENRLVNQAQANMEMVRNLAHEIKNPLGGIKGAAQLLELEVPAQVLPGLREYTQVIIKEAERLQLLVDRMLIPYKRDYDLSLPELKGNKEQLIQAVLNIAENAAHALGSQIREGTAAIVFRTRVARRVSIAGNAYRLALDLSIIDNGPGIPEGMAETVFFPLVSGKQGGTGLGLAISQSLIQKHGGLIACESVPGRTEFVIRLPYKNQYADLRGNQ